MELFQHGEEKSSIFRCNVGFNERRVASPNWKVGKGGESSSIHMFFPLRLAATMVLPSREALKSTGDTPSMTLESSAMIALTIFLPIQLSSMALRAVSTSGSSGIFELSWVSLQKLMEFRALCLRGFCDGEEEIGSNFRENLIEIVFKKKITYFKISNLSRQVWSKNLK